MKINELAKMKSNTENVQAQLRAENPAANEVGGATEGELADAPCSALNTAFEQRVSGWEIDFLDGEGKEIEMDNFTYAFDPSENTSRLAMIIEKSLSLFGIKAFARIRPRGFGGVIKGESVIRLRSGKKLKFDIFDFSISPKSNVGTL